MAKINNNLDRQTSMFVFYLLMVIGVGGAILFSIIKIQWINGDEWRARGEQREEGYQVDPARRGDILSSDGKILATTIPVCDLYFDLGHQYKRDDDRNILYDKKNQPIVEYTIEDSVYEKTIDTICGILHGLNRSKTAKEYKEMLDAERAKERPSRCLPIMRGIAYSSWKGICGVAGWNNVVVKQVVEKDAKGNDYTRSVIRKVRAHIYGDMAGNVVGFYNGAINKTYTGLEGYYDSVLKGRDGEYFCRRLTRGAWIPTDNRRSDLTTKAVDSMSVTIDSMSVCEKIDGKTIVAAIDTRYQDIAESSLRHMLQKSGAYCGCALLMEVETGYVLASANLLRDSNGVCKEVSYGDYANTRFYEPGSTFKTVTLTAMLDDETLNIDTAERVRIGGVKAYGKDCTISDDFGNGRDTANLKTVIEKSSNIGMCELFMKYYRPSAQRKSILQRVKKIFPYDLEAVDLQLGSHRSAHINDLGPLSDFLHFSHGYATLVTPLQVLTFYNALANDGKMVKPQFCKGYIENGKVVPFEPIVLRERICSPKTVAIMHDILLGVVEHGTARCIYNQTYPIAGKTGTAQFNQGGYYAKVFNSSFAGFFPANNPKYSCVVVLFKVPYRHGSEVAAPVFKQIADCVVAMDRDLNRSTNRIEDAGTTAPQVVKANQKEVRDIFHRLQIPYHSPDSQSYWMRSDSVGYVAYLPSEGRVPNCKGMTIKDAINLLHRQGLKVKFSGCGRVVSQLPQSGSACKKGATVVLKLGQ